MARIRSANWTIQARLPYRHDLSNAKSTAHREQSVVHALPGVRLNYGIVLNGREAILDAYAQRFQEDHPRIDPQAGEIIQSGDLAVLHGRFERVVHPLWMERSSP